MIVRIEYRSPRRISNFLFSPHAVVRTSQRIHFRGFSDRADSCGFVDLVAGRILDASERSATGFVHGSRDIAWRQKVDLGFRMDPDIPEGVRDALRQEAGALIEADGRLVLRGVRRALVPYVVREMRQRCVNGRWHGAWILDRSAG